MPEKLPRIRKQIVSQKTCANIALKLLQICINATNLEIIPSITYARTVRKIFQRGWNTISSASLAIDPSATSIGQKSAISRQKTQ